MEWRRWSSCVLLGAALLLLPSRSEAQQDLGHRVPGALGLYAGAQQPLGLYFTNRFQFSFDGRLYDKDGHLVETGESQDAKAIINTLGVTLTGELKPIRANVSCAMALFAGRDSINRMNAAPRVLRRGIGDLWVMPLEVGWRLPHIDLVADYAFYAPTAGFQFGEPISGLGTGHWTHEFSIGTTIFFDRDRTWSISALASYGLNMKDQGADVTHGDVVNLEGGAGKRLFGFFDVGVATFAHWQVAPDRGSEVPPPLVDVRTQLFAIGPEIDFTARRIRSIFTLRYVYDAYAQARFAGQTATFTYTIAPWVPSPRVEAEQAPSGPAR